MSCQIFNYCSQHRFAAMALRGLAAFNKKLRRSACEHSLNSRCATAASRGRWPLCFDEHSLNLNKTSQMPSAVKYIVDDRGEKTSVLVPIKLWEDLNANYQKMLNKLAVFTGIRQGLKEIEASKKTGKKLQTLKDFLK